MCIVYDCQCLQIIVQFPSPFWRNKMNTPHFFGHVSSSEQKRGLFPVFYDVTEKVRQCVENIVVYTLVTCMSHSSHVYCMSSATSDAHCIFTFAAQPSDTAGPFVLLSTVCGAAVKLLDSLTDEDLVELFVSTLKTLFPDLVSCSLHCTSGCLYSIYTRS